MILPALPAHAAAPGMASSQCRSAPQEIPRLSAPSISDRVAAILSALPPHVTLVAACKTRTPQEVREALAAGVAALGHNYVQEAEAMIQALGRPAPWRLIGHLQRNKAKKAVGLFDVVETVDSLRLAKALDRSACEVGKTLRVLVEINSGEEPNKDGVHPDDVAPLVNAIADMEHLHVEGLMTMGPFTGDPEDARPYFRKTKEVFDRLADCGPPSVEMKVLSMGMSNSYQVAIEEGANLVRLGTSIFGPRQV